MTTESRFVLLHSGRYLLPAAVGIGTLCGLLGAGPAYYLGAAILMGAQLLISRRRPILILDESGYRVEVAGKERFRVRWAEVGRVRYDRGEGALYADCGDRRRNLLVPPTRGYAFTFSERPRLVALVLAALEGRIEEVPDLASDLSGREKS